MTSDPHQLEKDFMDAVARADRTSAIDVVARVAVQAGAEVLVAGCPVCHHPPVGLGVGPGGASGRHRCRQCGALLRFVRPDK